MWDEMATDAVRSICADIQHGRYRSVGHDSIEALAKCVENQKGFGEHARSNFLDTLGSEIYDALNEDGESIKEWIRDLIDRKSFLASHHDLVEFSVLLNMKRGEYLDDTYIYPEDIYLARPKGLEALEGLLSLVNLSSQELADALDISDEAKASIASLYQADPERPVLLDVKSLIEVLDNSNGGALCYFWVRFCTGFIEYRSIQKHSIVGESTDRHS